MPEALDATQATQVARSLQSRGKARRMRVEAVAGDHSVASAARRHPGRQQTTAHAAACSIKQTRRPHAVSSKGRGVGEFGRRTFDAGAAKAIGRALSRPVGAHPPISALQLRASTAARDRARSAVGPRGRKMGL